MKCLYAILICLFLFFAGYFPDTDSEVGTLTANSPSEWTEKHGMSIFGSGKHSLRGESSQEVAHGESCRQRT